MVDIPSNQDSREAHERSSYLIELEMQNEMLRVAQEELTEALAKYSDLYDFSPIGYLTLDSNGIIIEANLTIADLLDCRRQEMLGRKFTDFIEPKDQDVFYRIRKKLAALQRQSGEVRLITSRSKTIHARLDCVCRSSADGRSVQRIAVSDIGPSKILEEKLRQLKDKYWGIIMDQSDLICRFTPDGTLTFVNNAYCNYYGISHDEVLGTNFMPDIHPDDLEVVTGHFKDLTLLNPSKTIVHRVVLPDGSLRWQQWSGRTIYDSGGRVVECQAVGRDITALKTAEEKLQQEAQLRQRFMDAMPCIAVLIRRDSFEIVAANRAALESGGVPETQCHYSLAHNHSACNWCLAQKMWQERREQHAVVWSKGRCWELHWIPIDDTLYLHYAFDITEQENNKLALQKTRDELERRVEERTAELREMHQQLLHSEKLSAIGRLSATIAHEFNNPLQGIVNVLGGLRRRAPLDEEDSKLADLAYEECLRMKGLVKNLQDFHRPTSGRIEQLNLHSVLDSVVALCANDVESKGVVLTKNYADQDLQIYAVSDQLKQVVLNLLNNATDACRHGDTITVSTRTNDQQVLIQVADTGTGIDPEMLPRIFEPFATTKSAKKGTGLGLTVSYGIVRKHGGWIEVASTPGEGSRFTITLPVDARAYFEAN